MKGMRDTDSIYNVYCLIGPSEILSLALCKDCYKDDFSWNSQCKKVKLDHYMCVRNLFAVIFLHGHFSLTII